MSRHPRRPSPPAAAAALPVGPDDLRQVVALLSAHERKIDALLAIVAPMVTRRVSVGQQARLAGVSRTTLWRRRRRAAAQFALRPHP